VPISELLRNKVIPEKYDWVGFIAPSYFSHVPPYVEKCMEDVIYTERQKIFLIVGCGGNRGLAIQDMRNHVHNSNKEVDLEYMVTLPGNYILSYGAFPMWYQKACTRLSYRKIYKIALDIQIDRKRKNLGVGLFYNSKYEPALQNSIKKFSAQGCGYSVSNQCTACGACIKLCPVGNISMTNGKVSFGDHCSQCMGCIQWCDHQAIDCHGKGANRKRYHHLNIKKSELFQR
jgi:ferredoxin